jgi:sigma-B regulation protein RsbU (phosphoserine phosphatase)
VYTLGVAVTVEESQRDAMQSAVMNESYIADAGNYVDYYSYMETIDGHDYLIGMTFDLTKLLTEVESQRRNASFTAMAYQIILSLICSLAIMFFVLRPLKIIQSSIRHYKDRKDSYEVRRHLERISMNNEIGELAQDVVEMTEEIDDHLERIRSITAERERIGAELKLATDIQKSTLPHIFPPFPDRTEMDIYALMDPAREVGGDFYDFFMIDDDHLCLVIADVSGKGIPASLFMMIAKIIIKSYAMLGIGPAEILSKTNETLCEDNRTDMFVTVWVGILELSTGTLRAANAGHEYPAIRHNGSKFELMKDKHGFVIGGIEDLVFTEYEVKMQPGSTLFVYTDGVPEASDSSNNMFGTERMLDSLNEVCESSPEDIIRHVRTSIDEFTRDGTQFDDLTMLCIRYNG